MSVILDFSIFPIGKGESLSDYAAQAVKLIKDSGLPHTMGPMGTSVEGEWDEVMALLTRCHNELRKDNDRVYIAVKIDSRKGAPGRLSKKVDIVEKKLE